MLHFKLELALRDKRIEDDFDSNNDNNNTNGSVNSENIPKETIHFDEEGRSSQNDLEKTALRKATMGGTGFGELLVFAFGLSVFLLKISIFKKLTKRHKSQDSI